MHVHMWYVHRYVPCDLRKPEADIGPFLCHCSPQVLEILSLSQPAPRSTCLHGPGYGIPGVHHHTMSSMHLHIQKHIHMHTWWWESKHQYSCLYSKHYPLSHPPVACSEILSAFFLCSTSFSHTAILRIDDILVLENANRGWSVSWCTVQPVRETGFL